MLRQFLQRLPHRQNLQKRIRQKRRGKEIEEGEEKRLIHRFKNND